jgi:large subunit ribosomal protein L11
MAKNIKAHVKLQLQGGGATPAPPVGSSLGQHGVSLMDFCKQFNAATSNRKGEVVPVEIVIYTDRSFSFITKTPLVSELIRKSIKIKKGSSNPGTVSAGSISWSAVEEIARIKLPDLNAIDIEGAKKIIAGSARSMGLTVID